MAVSPSSSGTITFTPLVAGKKTLASGVNDPLTTVFDRANSLTTDVNTLASAINTALTGGLNNSDNLTALATKMGGTETGTWPAVSYTFTAETLTGFKVNRDVYYYYQTPMTLTDMQPVIRMTQARTLSVAKAAYFRDNTTPPASSATVSVRKNGSEVGVITISSSGADKTWISTTSGFAGDVAFAVGDYLSLVVTGLGTTGQFPADISILLPFEEIVRLA